MSGKRKNFQVRYLAYEHPGQLPDSDRLLWEAAEAATALAYAPYSRFFVGAALRLEDGTILKGANQENASYPLCLCAERVALAAAHAKYPAQPVLEMAVTARLQGADLFDAVVSPCGACRQVIAETEYRYNRNIRLLLPGPGDSIYVFDSIQDLLPFSFKHSVLQTLDKRH